MDCLFYHCCFFYHCNILVYSLATWMMHFPVIILLYPPEKLAASQISSPYSHTATVNLTRNYLKNNLHTCMRCGSYIWTNFLSIWGFVTAFITKLNFIHTPVSPEDYSLSWMGGNITWLVHITRCNNDTHSAIQGCHFHTTCTRVCPEDGIMYPVNCYSSWTFQAPANHIWWFKMKEHYFQHSSWYLIYLSIADQISLFYGEGGRFFLSSLCWGQLCSPHSLLPIGF